MKRCAELVVMVHNCMMEAAKVKLQVTWHNELTQQSEVYISTVAQRKFAQLSTALHRYCPRVQSSSLGGSFNYWNNFAQRLQPWVEIIWQWYGYIFSFSFLFTFSFNFNFLYIYVTFFISFSSCLPLFFFGSLKFA